MDFVEVNSRKRKRRQSDSRLKLSNHIQTTIEKLFEKNFRYGERDDHKFEINFQKKQQLSQEWTINEYICMKDELNTLKNNLNDKNMITWHDHTRRVNLAGNVAPKIRTWVRPELCTQAWCKFYEIASTFLKVESTRSLVTVHLCEAPGAFVTSLNHYLFTHSWHGDWQWLATTLNPYYEGNNIRQMIDEDKFIRCSYDNWYFGEDGTGNLMSEVNLEGLKARIGNVEVDLVTADGSIDCQGDPAEQEDSVSRLQHCEVLTALHILTPGGTLVVKMFTMLECKAVCLMYLLNCVFETVDVFKPCTSKGGNSEVYVVGQGFKGRECCQHFLKIATPLYFGSHDPVGCLFSQADIPQAFLDNHLQCATFFKNCQMSAIQRNLDLFKVMTDDEWSMVEEERNFCMECFFNQYEMKLLPYSARIMKSFKRSRSGSYKKMEFAGKLKLEGKFTGSLHERLELSMLPWQQKVHTMETYEEEVDREDNSLWLQCQDGGISEQEMESVQMVRGRIVDQIQSSKFCDGFYLTRVQEIIKHCQHLAQPADTKFVKAIAQKLRETLSATLEYYKGISTQILYSTTDPNHSTTDLNQSTTDPIQSTTDPIQSIADLNHSTTDPNHTTTNLNQSTTDPKLISSCGLVKMKGCIENVENIENISANIKIPDVGEEHNLHDNVVDASLELAQNMSEPELTKSNITCEQMEISDRIDVTDTSDQHAGGDIHVGDESMTLQVKYTCSKQGSVILDEEDRSHVGGPTLQVNCVGTKPQPSSAVLKELSCQCFSDDACITLHCVSGDEVDCRLEFVEQRELLHAVQDILKFQTSDNVVIEMGTCLSRFTAGLVYILYRSFREIGFVHHHGYLLKRHLVCMDYKYCPIRLVEYLEEIDHMMEADQSASVLEIVPVLTLLNDEEFTSFLNISNVNLLQSFITTVIQKERQLHVLEENT